MPLRRALLLACGLLAFGGATHAAAQSAPADPPGLVVVLVRHAETAPDGTRDPGLSAAGHERAEGLAGGLADARIQAVYATEYRRTRETAAPTARAHGGDVVVVPYGAGPLDGYVARLAAAVRGHLGDAEAAGGTVLVVGHSNTTPALAGALLGYPVPPTGEDAYDREIRVRLRPDGSAALVSDVRTDA